MSLLDRVYSPEAIGKQVSRAFRLYVAGMVKVGVYNPAKVGEGQSRN